jgi:hypothetical protein
MSCSESGLPNDSVAEMLADLFMFGPLIPKDAQETAPKERAVSCVLP